MKFEYEAKEDDRECVAFIDEDGDLMVRSESDGTIWFSKNDGVYVSHNNHFNPSEAAHKFYPGDKLTIEF